MEKTEKAQLRKRQRIIKKIYEMIKNRKALFITMSFNDATMKKTNAETRKRYIKAYLNNETALYITNVDYGTKHEREHYHAIALTNTLKSVKEIYKPYTDIINLKAYKYGNIRADFIGAKYNFKTDKQIKETATHLYEHAIKPTTRNNKIIFSRCEPTESAQIERLKRLRKIFLNKPPIKDKEPTEQEIINITEMINRDLNTVKSFTPYKKKSIFYN